MIKVERHILIETVTPREVFAELSNPENLTTLLPRLRKATLDESTNDSARLTLCITIGNMFGTICFGGHLNWVEPSEINFHVKKPIDAKIQWFLTPTNLGTNVNVVACMDISPLLGPMAFFVPNDMVGNIIGSDLEHALQQVASRFELCLLPAISLAFQSISVTV
jgi:hypothetical protein